MFGSKSQLVEEVANTSFAGISTLGGGYQAATAIAALFFIFILVRYFDLFRYLILSSFSSQSSSSDMHLFLRDAQSIKLITCLNGALLLALLMMRLSVMPWAAPAIGVGPDLSAWAVGGFTLAGILITLFGEGFVLYLVGIIGGRSDACSILWSTKLLYFNLIIVLMSPMIILALLTEGIAANIALYLCCNMFAIDYFVPKRDFFTLSLSKIFYFPLDFISLRPGNLPNIVATRSDSSWIESHKV